MQGDDQNVKLCHPAEDQICFLISNAVIHLFICVHVSQTNLTEPVVVVEKIYFTFTHGLQIPPENTPDKTYILSLKSQFKQRPK